MKPTDLKPGRKYTWRGKLSNHSLEFLLRVPRNGKIPPANIFRCADFAGLDSATDPGTVTISDYQVRKELQ